MLSTVIFIWMIDSLSEFMSDSFSMSPFPCSIFYIVLISLKNDCFILFTNFLMQVLNWCLSLIYLLFLCLIQLVILFISKNMKSFSGVSPIQLFLVSDEECMSVEVLYGLMSHNFCVPLLYFPNLFGCMNLSGFLPPSPPFPNLYFSHSRQ